MVFLTVLPPRIIGHDDGISGSAFNRSRRRCKSSSSTKKLGDGVRTLFDTRFPLVPRNSYNVRQLGRIDSGLQQVVSVKSASFSVALMRWIVQPLISGSAKGGRVPWEAPEQFALARRFSVTTTASTPPKRSAPARAMQNGNISEVVQMIFAVVIGQRLGEKICPPDSQWRFDFLRHQHGLRTYPCD
jgi:hypothetical protein